MVKLYLISFYSLGKLTNEYYSHKIPGPNSFKGFLCNKINIRIIKRFFESNI